MIPIAGKILEFLWFRSKIPLFVVTLNLGMLKSLVHLPVRHGDMANLSVRTARTSGVALLVSFLDEIPDDIRRF